MSKEIYPAIFSSDGQTGYTVTFPDLLGCVTEGDTLEEAVTMAEEQQLNFSKILQRALKKELDLV